MDPPKVMLEASFLQAVMAPEHPEHRTCADAYRDLLERYERNEVLLVAVGDHLRATDHEGEITVGQRVSWFLHRPRVGVFAPVDPLYVGFQHRRAADATPVDDPDVALTLVMCDRHGVRRVATVNPAYLEYDLDLLPVAPV
jgi:predicted nucleic acid-binding protein